MLDRLLDIKTRREKRLRSGLGRIVQQQESLQLQFVQVQQQQIHLRQAWRELTQKGGCFNQHQFARLRTQLASMQEQHAGLLRQLANLANEQNELTRQLCEQEAQLKANLREQEKLGTLLE